MTKHTVASTTRALDVSVKLLNMARLRMSRAGVADLELTCCLNALRALIENGGTNAQWKELNETVEKNLKLLNG